MVIHYFCRMIDVVVIGFGNVGFHLCKGLIATESVNLTQIFSRNSGNSAFGDISIIKNLNDLAEADLYIIAVTDGNIKEVAEKLPFNNRLVVHASGSTCLEILPKKNRKGVFYPLQTFSRKRNVDWRGVPICVEAQNEDDLRLLENLVKALSGNCYTIDSQQRKILHLAAVFCSNFVNHLYTIGSEICVANDMPFDILKPLIHETANKIIDLSPIEAQTGPAKRFDQKTIDEQLKSIENSSQKLIYELLTKSIQGHEKKL